MVHDELRRKNARLRDQIAKVVKEHQELRDDEVALKQGMYTQLGVPFLEQIQDNLRESALAVVVVNSELLRCLKSLLS